MATLREEARLKFVARLDQRTQEKPIEAVTPAWEPAYPGTEAKKAILAWRVAKKLPLHHPQDCKLPLGLGWRIRVGPNGRIIDKQLTKEDEAGIIVVAPELTDTILEAVKREFGPYCPHIIGCEPPPRPARKASRAA